MRPQCAGLTDRIAVWGKHVNQAIHQALAHPDRGLATGRAAVWEAVSCPRYLMLRSPWRNLAELDSRARAADLTGWSPPDP
jgi:hypothetical protein